MLIMGVDPGAATGLVLVDLPRYPMLDGGKIVAHTTVHRPAKSKKNPTEAARDSAFFELLDDTLANWRPIDVAVIERPADQTGFGRLQARGTAFSLGSNYALALAACWSVGVPGSSVASYPVLDFHGEKGWLREIKGPFARTKEHTLHFAKALATGTLGVRDYASWSEHESMALAMLSWHCAREAANQPQRRKA